MLGMFMYSDLTAMYCIVGCILHVWHSYLGSHISITPSVTIQLPVLPRDLTGFKVTFGNEFSERSVLLYSASLRSTTTSLHDSSSSSSSPLARDMLISIKGNEIS